MLPTLRFLAAASLLILLFQCKGPQGAATLQPTLYNITEQTENTLPVTESVTEMEALIAPYKAQLDEKMDRQLATVVTPLLKDSPEGGLGNWMADIMAQAGRDLYPDLDIAFAATNPGGLRLQEIAEGPLLVSEIYELMPFDNKLVVLDLTGAQVKEFLAHMANSGGWPVSEDLAVDLTSGSLNFTVNGNTLDPERSYRVVSIDYVANGGSGASMLKDKPRITTNHFLRDILIEYAEKTPEIDVRVTGDRWRL